MVGNDAADAGAKVALDNPLMCDYDMLDCINGYYERLPAWLGHFVERENKPPLFMFVNGLSSDVKKLALASYVASSAKAAPPLDLSQAAPTVEHPPPHPNPESQGPPAPDAAAQPPSPPAATKPIPD